MGRKIPTFSKLAMSVFIAILALTFLFASGTGGFLKPSSAEAENSAIGLTKDNLGIRKAIEAQDRHNNRLRSIPGVVGFGTGIDANGKPVIRVFTRRVGIPAIPENLDGIPVHVKVTGEFIALSDPTAEFERPVPIGVSTGHPDITAGTLGARVKDEFGNVYALSNNHVYANTNYASIGDNALQPGPYDGGNDPDDKIGELYAFEWIDFSLYGSNTIDAAIVRTTSDNVGNSTLPEGYGTPNSTIFGDSNGDGYFDNEIDLLSLAVQKFGRTTGLTRGQVTEVNVTSAVCYANCSNPLFAEYAWFDDQIAITSISTDAFSLGGDSGSLIVTDDENKYPVGLLFAGSSTNTLANRIDLVLNHFDVSIDDTAPSEDVEICDDGIDNDNDDAIDCDDLDCVGNPVCSITEAEICDDGLDNDGDGDSDCYDNDCETECAALYCFKGRLDGDCNPKKDGELCPDCLGTTPPDNEVCNSGVDEDGDGLTDCDDPDCYADPECGDCLSKGSGCTLDEECCNGKCRGGKCR